MARVARAVVKKRVDDCGRVNAWLRASLLFAALTAVLGGAVFAANDMIGPPVHERYGRLVHARGLAPLRIF